MVALALLLVAVHHHRHPGFLGIVGLLILVGAGVYFWGRRRERIRAARAQRETAERPSKWGN
jgi:LPXTG-motif cell wall-anchored protein